MVQIRKSENLENMSLDSTVSQWHQRKQNLIFEQRNFISIASSTDKKSTNNTLQSFHFSNIQTIVLSVYNVANNERMMQLFFSYNDNNKISFLCSPLFFVITLYCVLQLHIVFQLQEKT